MKTFLEPFPGVPSHLGYTQKLAKSTLALKLSVTTYFHWVTTTIQGYFHSRSPYRFPAKTVNLKYILS